MGCIPKILALKGDKEFLNVRAPNGNDVPSDIGLTIEGGGKYKDHDYLITFTGCGHRCGYVDQIILLSLIKEHNNGNKELD